MPSGPASRKPARKPAPRARIHRPLTVGLRKSENRYSGGIQLSAIPIDGGSTVGEKKQKREEKKAPKKKVDAENLPPHLKRQQLGGK